MEGARPTVDAEGIWAGGLIYAAIRQAGGADAELQICRREHTLLLMLGGRSELTKVKISGSSVYEGQQRAGCLTCIPSDAEYRGWYRNADLRAFVMLIDPGFMRAYEFGLDALDLPSFTGTRDPLLRSVLWSLAREMQDEGQGLPPVYVEHAAGLLMAHLVHSAGRERSRQVSRAGLSDLNLRRVVAFIEENLGQDISLTALAALTGTGVDVFARNFKASTGVPPYRYVLERRIYRAQALLAGNDKSIAEIAFEVGFSSQAHFTTQFTKLTHMSPAAYRARRRW